MGNCESFVTSAAASQLNRPTSFTSIMERLMHAIASGTRFASLSVPITINVNAG